MTEFKKLGDLLYVDKGDYVEIISPKRVSCAWVRSTSKGRYFIHKGKRIYI